MKSIRVILLVSLCLTISSSVPKAAEKPRTESYLGNLAPIIRAIQQDTGFPLAFENRKGMSVGEWQLRGRAELQRTLSYSPRSVPLDLKVEQVIVRQGYETRRISFAGSPYYRIPACLLVPTHGRGPFPAVVALHDHGGFFYSGKKNSSNWRMNIRP